MRFFFTGSLPALASRRRFSMTCSGAWATTLPRSSKPLRPPPPASWGKPPTRGLGVGAERGEPSLLREPLDEATVFGQEARVVGAEAGADEPTHVLAVRGV